MADKKGRRRRFGAVRQYRSGSWTAPYLAPDGERVRADEAFETKKDAEIWLSQADADPSRGDWRAPDAGAVNFRVYAEKWVDERELAVRAEDLYKHLLRLNLLPTFGALDSDEITAPRVREWRSERLRTTGAKTTVAKAYRLLKGIFETAVDDDLVSRNPCRIKGAGKESAAERRVATVAQVDALADAIGIRWRLMVHLGAYGPMRPEELAGLRRRDVDPDNLVIRVRVAEPERTNGKRAPGETKSDAGVRAVVLPAFLRKEVRQHLAWFAEKGQDGLLFVGETPTRSGSATQPQGSTTWFVPSGRSTTTTTLRTTKRSPPAPGRVLMVRMWCAPRLQV
ncbi:site-specific integrase (plasmid) [Streptomyces sp. NBC_01450]|uniref:tyrosine-type recombinase/integrase n=1 Tax=Streptomyces sp. NBC_01450 TaxID=2903871 RepID=UPI002E36D7CB|nr:site-specific integrase [Streptomyces sp. NBC_01450]